MNKTQSMLRPKRREAWHPACDQPFLTCLDTDPWGGAMLRPVRARAEHASKTHCTLSKTQSMLRPVRARAEHASAEAARSMAPFHQPKLVNRSQRFGNVTTSGAAAPFVLAFALDLRRPLERTIAGSARIESADRSAESKFGSMVTAGFLAP